MQLKQFLTEQMKQLHARKSLDVTGRLGFCTVEMAASEGKNEGGGGGTGETSPWINPAKMSDRERLDLIKRIEAREVASIQFWAHVFGDGFNQNRLKLTPAQVRQAAKSAAGIAALDGHGGWGDGSPASHAVGSITKGRSDKLESGETVATLAHRISNQRAMIEVVSGTWLWFSVSLAADQWMDELLDKDGKVTKDWDSAVDYRITALGEVWMTHNAFVSDPAWLGSAFLARTAGGTQHEGIDMSGQLTPPAAAPAVVVGEDVEKLKADLTASQARVGELELALKAEKAAHFSAVFDAAKTQGRVKESEREMLAFVAEGKGIPFVAAQLSARDPLVPLRTVGEAPNATPPASVKNSTEKRPGAEGELKHLGGSPEAEQDFIRRGRRPPKALPKK